MPIINFPKGTYQRTRLVTQPLKEGTAGEGKKLNNEQVKVRSEENRLNLELGHLSEQRKIRTLLISSCQRFVRTQKNLRLHLKQTINMFYKLCPTDCENIITVFLETNDLSPSEQRTLDTVKKIRELMDIRHQDNIQRDNTRKRLAEVRGGR